MDSSSSSSDDETIIAFVNRLGQPRKQRVFRNRTDNFLEWDENEFFNRFRLTKRCVNIVLDLITFKIQSSTNRNHAVTPAQMILITIRFLASSGMLIITVGDFAGIHKTTAGKHIWKVLQAIGCLSGKKIKCFHFGYTINRYIFGWSTTSSFNIGFFSSHFLF
ncbi:unnamed protein product [Macrosiphum euphorbiae]|uniref:Nuclease HARBI1 n=1 Tax=Macrosiphum euphorbiae TaxID=13131 RepID=A0AAV0WRQ4_9HEMI|nr:unnamed protein product [Macrosiphum euphorbiae]